MDYQMVPEDGQGVPERTPDPAGAIPAADPRSPAPAASRYTDATAPASAAGELGAAGETDAERPLAVPAPRAEPGPARPSPAAKDSTRWYDIQAMFIDDPRASTELAASLVDASVEALVGVRQGAAEVTAVRLAGRRCRNRGAAHDAPAVPRVLEPPRRLPP